jgi:epsilon-lactone hydrolase
MSLRLGALDLWLRLVEKPRLARARSVPAARARLERLVALMGEGVAADEVRLGGGPALRIPAPAGAGILLWLHGGAYCLGSPRTHVALVAALARRAGIGAVLPGYRRAPEHPFPAAVEDSRAAWAALRAEGWPAARIALGGDSAGGGLVFALLHGLLADGEPPPSCVVAFSPWADLTLAGASLAALARRDAFLPAHRLAEVRDLYLAGADPGDPRASPHRGRFRGAPPALIQTSRSEILLDDARMMAARLAADGVEVTLDLWNATPHVWQFYHGRLPEADIALDRAAAFLVRHLPLKTA